MVNASLRLTNFSSVGFPLKRLYVAPYMPTYYSPPTYFPSNLLTYCYELDDLKMTLLKSNLGLETTAHASITSQSGSPSSDIYLSATAMDMLNML